MAQSLSPFVYWAQKENLITLKVDLRDVKEPNVDLKQRLLNFNAFGSGAKGQSQYSFHLDFYGNINLEESVYKVHESKIEFNLIKENGVWWPRLIAQPQKPHWLKIDFDKWEPEADGDTRYDIRGIKEDYPGAMDYLQKVEYGYRKERWKNVYLVFYNLFQFIGFLYILIVMGIRYYRHGTDSIAQAFETVGNAFKFCQLIQYLEVMHPMFGYTKGGALIPFLQVTGRAFILFVMIDAEERMQTKPVVFYLFLIWALIEVVRYPYYITTIIDQKIYLLTWLRYSMWIPLYPLGVLCEGIAILRNIPYYEETQRFTVTLPNKFNATFDMPMFLKIYLMILILPGIYFLMNHMSKARIKNLGSKSKHRND